MKLATRCIACDSPTLGHRPAVLMPFVAYRIFGWEPVAVTDDWGLRDLKPGTAYSVCKSMQCGDCGMLFLDMRFDDEEMGALYRDYRGEVYAAERARFEPGYGARNDTLLAGSAYTDRVETFIRPHLPAERPHVLDWGGDTGVNTPFRQAASAHDIYDISSRPPLPGARIVSFDEVRSRRYDLVVFANVLEHVSWPRAALAEIAAIMSPETALYLETPQEDVVRLYPAAEDRLARKRHWHEHVNFFTEAALRAVFAAAGLRIVDLLVHPVTAGGKESHVFSVVARREATNS